MIEILQKSKHKKAKRKLPELTVNMWLAAVQEDNASREEPVPEGYQSLDEVSWALQMCRSKTLARIKQLELAGRVRRVKVRRLCVNGKIRVFTYYKVLPK